MRAMYLPEPELEFGYGGRHEEPRAGLKLHGPADITWDGRPERLRIGLIGQADSLAELEQWLGQCSAGIAGRTDTTLSTLFPEFPGFQGEETFQTSLEFPAEAKRVLTRKDQAPIKNADSKAERIGRAVDVVAAHIEALADDVKVDVVLVVRPPGVPEGNAGEPGAVGVNFHDVLKARVITAPMPIQIIRPRTWRGGRGVEDEATRAWNLITALYYKAGGKPWRLSTPRDKRTRCYVGVSFTRSDDGDHLHTSVAQVFNELGDGVVVRGALARRSGPDKQPHLERGDAEALLASALDRYRQVHGNMPADVTVHKTSSFSHEEHDGFWDASEGHELNSCDLVWVTDSEDAFLVRGTSTYPPMRGTLLTLDDENHALYTHGSIPYYRTYPGMYMPHALGIRPAHTDRAIEEIATEVLALSKLNWNRARLDSRKPITLLTARRVGEVLRHVPEDVTPAARYAFYM